MKFGHAYKEFLVEGGFPAEWVNSAISYQKLKKCIKQVRLELASLGLNPETLQLLLSGAEEDRKAADEADEDDRALRYEFEDGNSKAAKSGAIKPKLLFLVDEATGEPIDARLSPETKSYIHQLALNQKLTNVRISNHDDTESLAATDSRRSSDFDLADDHSSRRVSKPHRLIEIPLTSDSDFFNLLQNELSGLAHLQKTERMKLHDEIAVVGNALVKAADPNSKRGKADLDKWRRLFELYIESRIFFSTAEQSHGLQTYTAAQERYSKFLTKATEVGLLGKYKMRESGDALKGFLSINGELLMNLRFHEINQIAMNKILKKFDKRTALGAQSAFPTTAVSPIRLSKDLSQAVSQQITTSILATIPSLDDYLCPICSELAWRPIRLRCSHIFCIRCLIRLQREKKDRCPLCREDVVMHADSTCIDEGMINHLKLWFPKEVKEKQRLNEKLAAYEEFGDMGDGRCQIM